MITPAELQQLLDTRPALKTKPLGTSPRAAYWRASCTGRRGSRTATSSTAPPRVESCPRPRRFGCAATAYARRLPLPSYRPSSAARRFLTTCLRRWPDGRSRLTRGIRTHRRDPARVRHRLFHHSADLGSDMKRTLATLALTACLAPAHAGFYTGNDWLRHYTSTQTHDQVAILAYTAGVADGHPNICIPAGVTLGQLADMVRDSLVALPAMRHHPAAAFVIATLEPVWPCKPVPARSQV